MTVRINTPANPAARGEMIACWRNGRRVLLPSSEVARLMGKGKQNAEKQNAEDETPRAGPRPVRPSGAAGEAQDARDNGGRANAAAAAADLTPLPIVPRSRRLAESEGWQMLAREMARVAGHPARCHQRVCRRAGKCRGGKDACYLREFETVDVIMQRSVLPLIAREARELGLR